MIALKDVNYKVQDLACCDTCKNVYVDEDGCYSCNVIKDNKGSQFWYDAVIEPMGICDCFEKRA